MTFSIKTFSTLTTVKAEEKGHLEPVPEGSCAVFWSPSERCWASQRREVGLVWEILAGVEDPAGGD